MLGLDYIIIIIILTAMPTNLPKPIGKRSYVLNDSSSTRVQSESEFAIFEEADFTLLRLKFESAGN